MIQCCEIEVVLLLLLAHHHSVDCLSEGGDGLDRVKELVGAALCVKEFDLELLVDFKAFCFLE